MENVKHIKNITIENFKCFEFLSVENFEQFNIILGDNNVGKTSFLEAFLFNENASHTINNFQTLLYYKNVFGPESYLETDPFIFFINKFSDKKVIEIILKTDDTIIKNKFETVSIENLSIEQRATFPKYFSSNKNDKEILKVTKNDSEEFRSFNVGNNFENFDTFIPFVHSNCYYNSDLVDFYSNNFSENRESKKTLIEQFQFLVPTLVDIELTLNYNKKAVLGFWISKNVSESLIPLPMFGDGTIRLFRLIMEVIMCANKFICIDEIDTGIHYSKFKDFSKVIISTAHKNNVQLFITTHNNEFLKAFKEVLEEIEFKKFQDKTKCFSLKKLPRGETKAYSYNFDEFEFAIEQENELR